MKNSGKYKFIASAFFLFLLPFLILSVHFVRGNKEIEKKDTLAYMELRTRTVANVVADLLTLNYDVSRFSSSAEFLKSSGSARKKMLEDKIRSNPSIYSEFSIVNVSGKEVLKTGQDSKADLKDYSKTGLFKSAVSGREPSGAVEYGEYTPPALVLMEPMVKGRGPGVEGFLLARMSLAYLGEVVRFMGRGSYGNLGFIDAGGQVISDSLGRSIIDPGIKAPVEVLRAVDAAAAKRLGDFKSEVRFKGRPYLVSVVNISGTSWWVFEVVDASRPLNPYVSFWAKRVILTGIILIFIFSFISYKLALRWLASEGRRNPDWRGGGTAG
jgi:hypothetical protein